MPNYEPDIIHSFADSLYEKADQLLAQYALLGFLMSGGFTFLILYFVSPIQANIAVSLMIAIFGGYVGHHLALPKAFSLKLQAQVALCQVQIETNTNKASHLLKAQEKILLKLISSVNDKPNPVNEIKSNPSPVMITNHKDSLDKVNCPDCHEIYSKKAKECPKCGHPTELIKE